MPTFLNNYPSNDPLVDNPIYNNNQWIQAGSNIPWLLTSFNIANISYNNSPYYQYLYVDTSSPIQINYNIVQTNYNTAFNNYVLADLSQYFTTDNTTSISTPTTTIVEGSGSYTLVPSTRGTSYYYAIGYNTVSNLAAQYSYLTYTINTQNETEGEGEGEAEGEAEGEGEGEGEGGGEYDSSTTQSSLMDLASDSTFNNIPIQYSVNTIGVNYAVGCFIENTKILCFDNDKEIYIPIQNIRRGTLIKTLKNGYLPVDVIGKCKFINWSNNDRIIGKLYKYSKNKFSELFEDLYMTGGHAALVDQLTTTEHQQTLSTAGYIFMVDDKYRLLACIDEKTESCIDIKEYMLWHLALEDPDPYGMYGIYANGLLVESCNKVYLEYTMELVW